MTHTIVLISGANRGLGRGLLERYLARPNHTVIAANRNVEHVTSHELFDLPKGPGSRLLLVQVDSNSDSDALEAVKELQRQGVEHLDIVVANAGAHYSIAKVSEVKIVDMQQHIEPNVFGTIRLYQAMLPLLLKSTSPKWITVGSGAGFLEVRNQPPVPNAAYASSKVAVHWLTRRMNAEEELLTAFIIDPGFVQTDMGNAGARLFGMDQAPLPLKASCDGMMAVFDTATKELHGGGLWSWEGKKQPW